VFTVRALAHNDMVEENLKKLAKIKKLEQQAKAVQQKSSCCTQGSQDDFKVISKGNLQKYPCRLLVYFTCSPGHFIRFSPIAVLVVLVALLSPNFCRLSFSCIGKASAS